MEPFEITLMQAMSPEQRAHFEVQFVGEKKSPTTALILTLFLGGFGAHHFYLRKTGLGVLYAVFVWTLIPALVAFVELFFIMGRTRDYNQTKAAEIAFQIRTLYPVQSTSQPVLSL
jgi:TM2 domain-containing membrane protein YozV